MQWNFFRRNKDKGLGGHPAESKETELVQNEKWHTAPGGEIKDEDQLETIKGGYSSENPSEREWFQGEQEKAVDALETKPEADELTEGQLEQVQTYGGTKLDGSRSDFTDDHIESQKEIIKSFSDGNGKSR